MSKICVQKAAILNFAAILDFGTETEMVPNLDVFRIQKPSSVPIFTTFFNLNNRLVLFHQSAALDGRYVPVTSRYHKEIIFFSFFFFWYYLPGF